MHLRSLERFDYDSVLLPYNYPLMQDPCYRRDVERLLAVCGERDVAVQTIKSIARRRWADTTPREARKSWYEPLTDPDAIARAMAFVLGNPALFIDSSSAIDQLPHVLAAAASNPGAPGQDALAADVSSFDMAPLFDGAELERI